MGAKQAPETAEVLWASTPGGSRLTSACRSGERCRRTGWRSRVSAREVSPGPFQQRVAFAIGRRLGQETGGLVDDQDVAILVQYLQPPRGRLGSRPARALGQRRLRLDLARRVEAGLAGHVDLPVPNRCTRPSPRQAELLRDSLVQTHRPLVISRSHFDDDHSTSETRSRSGSITANSSSNRWLHALTHSIVAIRAFQVRVRCDRRAYISWNRAESLVQNGRSGRFLKRVNNPTTAPDGGLITAGVRRDASANPAENVPVIRTRPAGSDGRDQEWTPDGGLVPSRKRVRDRRRRQGGWKRWFCPG